MKKVLQIAALASFFSCETEITPQLPNVDPLVAVDAWLYHKAEAQTITIYKTNTYFDNSQPKGISGANVAVINNVDSSEQYVFLPTQPGTYTWQPADPTDTFGILGESYRLLINLEGTTYASTSTINRVPTIDSITWRVDEDNFLANFWARDFAGSGDTYWIKSWKNGKLLTKPSEINITYDASFSAGSNSDGLFFIRPIRENINPFDYEDDILVNPFKLGDSIFVEINSISNEAFFFLEQVQIQTDRPGGFEELFATPLANVQSNIFSRNPKEKVVGFFNISASSGLGKVFLEEDIRMQ